MSVFSSPYLVVPFVSWFIAQALKFALKASHGDFSWRYFYKSGDMPSSHTAIVVALLVTLGFLGGVESPEFGIGAVFSLIVVYDAFGVRRAVGEQGGVLARLIELTRTPKAERDSFKIREVLGHTPIEVTAGGLLGWFVSTLLMYNYWPTWGKNILSVMGQTEQKAYLIVFGISIFVGLLINRLYSRRKYKKLPTSKRILRMSRMALIVPAVFGLIVLWLQNESVRFFTTKFWILATLLWVVIFAFVGYFRVFRGSRFVLEEEADYFKKTKKYERKSRSKKKQRRKK